MVSDNIPEMHAALVVVLCLELRQDFYLNHQLPGSLSPQPPIPNVFGDAPVSASPNIRIGQTCTHSVTGDNNIYIYMPVSLSAGVFQARTEQGKC